MNVCIPVNEDKGLHSPVSAHLGSAPMFMMVETPSHRCRAIVNDHQPHAHGQCSPLASLQGESIDVVVAGGIGKGALDKLLAAGIRVCLTEDPTVADVMNAFHAGTLRTMQPEMARCRQHDAGH